MNLFLMRVLRLLPVTLLALTLACASAPSPKKNITRNQQSRQTAQETGAEPVDPIEAILTPEDRALVPREHLPADSPLLQYEPGDPTAYPDDGSVWPAVNQWDDTWELRYIDWVEKNIDENFLIRHKQWSDCADFPYMTRWIFARENLLPQGCHDRFGNVFGSWSTHFSEHPRAKRWYNDIRFLEALDEVKCTVQCRSMPYDTYPVAILPRHGFLRPGTVVTNKMHSLVVNRVDRRDFYPIWLASSTLPPMVRKLTIEALHDGMEFSGEKNWGFVNFNWWVRDPATRRWGAVPDEQMPGYSLQQYRLMTEAHRFGELLISGLLQQLYAYKATNGEEAFDELSADLLSVLELRQSVVRDALDWYGSNRWAKGDIELQEYDDYSTHSRDARLRVKFQNLHRLVEMGLISETGLYERLASVSFPISPKSDMTLLELDYALRRSDISPEPWDSLYTRWGAGDWRLVFERILDRKYRAYTQPAPGGGLIGETETGVMTRFDRDGREVWSVEHLGSTPAAIDAPRGMIFKNDPRRLTRAFDLATGEERWVSDASPGDSIIYLGVAGGLVLAVSEDGGALALDAATGAERWRAKLGIYPVGAALGPDGTLAAISRRGEIRTIAPGGAAGFSASISSKVMAPPMVDAQGRVYALGLEGVVTAFDGDGARLWSAQAGGRLVFPSVAGPDGMLYIVGGHTVACMTPGGSTRWIATVGQDIYASPAIGADGMVYIAALDHYLYAISPNGKQSWSFQASSSILTPPVAGENGLVYVMPVNSRLMAIRKR